MPENILPILFKFIKFGLAGFVGLVIDFGITYLIKEKLRWNKYVANSLGFLIACSINYLINRAWTFENSDPGVGVQFSKFLLVAITGFALNNLIIYLLTDKGKINFYISKFCAIVLVFFWNFTFNYFFIFKS